MENNRSNDNLPRYIEVYNKILRNIKQGLYEEENKLPNENKLAEQMGVSRMTLRQAILLLQEDGVVESRQGVGNFIHKQAISGVVGLEQKGNVLEKCGLRDFDQVICVPQLGTSNFYSDDVFERNVPVLCGSNLFYHSKNKCCAHCFSIIPMDVDFISGYDIMVPEQVIKLLSDDIYKYAKAVQFEIKIIKNQESLIDNGFDKDIESLLLIIEKMMDYGGKVICLNKYHIPVQYVNIKINALKNND